MLNIDHRPCGFITDPHGRIHNIYRVGDEIYIADANIIGKLKRPPQNETHFFFAGRLYPKSIATRGDNT